jgi:mRNA-degrading endonuclease toxin of MazEF toxin-antitoxin module
MAYRKPRARSRPARILPAAHGRGPLNEASVVSCDNIVTVPQSVLGRQIGYLLPAQETALTEAIHAAFDLD